MKSTYKLFTAFLLIVGFIATEEVQAQDGNYYTVRDLEAWTGAKLKYQMNKKWSISLEHEFRFEDNASLIDQSFTELGLKRKIGKDFSAAFGARFLQNNDNAGDVTGTANQFRWNADFGYKTDVNRFTILSRLRYQSRTEFSSDEDAINGLRLKVGTAYNIKKWKFDPEFSTEIFNEINSLEFLDKIRFTLGTSYKIKKFGEISGFYRLERELVGAYPQTTNILGIRYQYTFKNKKK